MDEAETIQKAEQNTTNIWINKKEEHKSYLHVPTQKIPDTHDTVHRHLEVLGTL